MMGGDIGGFDPDRLCTEGVLLTKRFSTPLARKCSRRCEHACVVQCVSAMRMPAACPGCEGRGGWTREPTGRELEPLQGLRGVWAARECVISDFLLYLTGHQGDLYTVSERRYRDIERLRLLIPNLFTLYLSTDVPGRVCGEPVVVDSGRNWLTLSWPKVEHRGGPPVLAYRVEAWLLGEDGGAVWTELGVSPINSFDAFNLKPGAEYKFRVTPRNRYGWGESVSSTSPVVVGRSNELPEFIRILPGQLKALHGANIRLDCQVKGEPTPAVRWYKDGTAIDLDSCPRYNARFDGANCQLSVEDLRDADTGRYMCEASNKAGRASSFARLMVVSDPKIWQADAKLKRNILEDESDVDGPPQFTMRLRDRRVQMTYPVRLTCQVVGRPTPEITWRKDGHEVRQDERHAFCSEEHFHTLEISQATLEDGGNYSASARNAHGAVSCKCHLVVDKGIRAYVAPEFLSDLDMDITVKEGGELRLAAQVEAYPTVGVMW
uniref:Uncharacterized protein n=1 Tax=Timema cristinae TaxID=61476 RepID=A0A7R9CQB9_TIMCR|nr:unnamed protein product [Timema cristinae]